jgi:hypothetical protein
VSPVTSKRGCVLGQETDFLFGGVFVTKISQSSGACAEAVAQQALGNAHVWAVIGLMNGEVFKSGPADVCRLVAGFSGAIFEDSAVRGGEWGGHEKG